MLVPSRDAAEMLADLGAPILKSEITMRVPFTEASTVGMTINEYAPRSPASEEIAALAMELLTKCLQAQPQRASERVAAIKREIERLGDGEELQSGANAAQKAGSRQ